MNLEKYNKIVKRHTKKEKHFHNYLASFISGGLIGFFSQAFYLILSNLFSLSSFTSKSVVTLLVIFVSSLLTAIGIFDNLITKYRCGIIIPTTGFAHSISSAAIDFKKEGLIKGMGSNFFHLAGSVILYSIVTSFVLVLVKVIFFA